MHRRSLARANWLSGVFAFAIIALNVLPSAAQSKRTDVLKEWAVVPGVALSVDTDGYDLPTSIAMVPHPGPGPKDPLYFVTELHGRVKVVTNDRSVYTFAEKFFHLEPIPRPKPGEYLPELGMAGICLDPVHGYVFVSFTYQFKDRTIRNNIVRFQSTPQTFSLKPSGSLAFTEIFNDQVGDDSHMIGPMIVQGEILYVHVGDAHAAHLTRSLSSTAGKILRMTLDGKPLPDNPYYVDDNIKNPANFVWARGLRNPFGVSIVNGGYFVDDVGPSVDRFLRVDRGGDYAYDGTDWSISSHAKVVFAPSNCPVQLVYLPADGGPLPADWGNAFYLVASGDQLNVGPSKFGKKSLIRIRYDFARDEVIDRPVEIMKYVGSGTMMPVGLGIGPDGLYIAVFNPQLHGTTYVMKLRYDPAHAHKVVFGQTDRLMEKYACVGCHQPDGQSPGPPLDPEHLIPRLTARLNSDEYEAQSKKLDKLDEEPFRSTREARREVREAKGDEKLRIWIKHRLMNPRFDSPTAAMPKLGISKADAKTIAQGLVAPIDESLVARAKEFMATLVPYPRQRHLVLFFFAGTGFGAVGLGVLVLAGRGLRRRWRRGSAKPAASPKESSTTRNESE